MESSTLAPSLPSSWYHSSSHFLAEKENIFKKEWIFIGHAQEIPEPNDYITRDVMGIPVVILRNEDNNIQILLNICSHRGAPLLTEKKGQLTKPTLMCRYHGWCYNTDGSFKHAPFIAESSPLLDLKKISWQELNGMIFVSFNPNPYAFQERKEKILQEMNNAAFNIKDYKFNSQITREGNFNWKIWTEGFQECYHCPTIHPIFNRDFHLSKYQVHNKDHFSVHECPRKEKSSTGSFEGLWLWLFPNCGLPCYEKVYYSMRVNPKSPNTTELIYTFFTKSNFETDEQIKFFDFIKQITDEDIEICEQVQKNMEQGSGEQLFEIGHLNVARENGVHYFHQLVRNAIESSPITEYQAKQEASYSV